MYSVNKNTQKFSVYKIINKNSYRAQIQLCIIISKSAVAKDLTFEIRHSNKPYQLYTVAFKLFVAEKGLGIMFV